MSENTEICASPESLSLVLGVITDLFIFPNLLAVAVEYKMR